MITNSLAANNHAVVHSGYGPTRRALLEAGASLHEVKPDFKFSGTRRAGLGADSGTLHTKAYVVDSGEFFLGSFNWDPRSAFINTEMGVIIQSPEVVSYASKQLAARLAQSTYQVKINDKGKLRWYDSQNGEMKVWTKEPETGFWRRTMVRMLGWLPLDSQL